MGERREFWRGTSAAFAALSAGYLPVMLVGVLAVELEAGLGLTPIDIGWVIATYWIANAIAAPVGGHRADRRGWVTTSLAGVLLAGLMLLVIGTAVDSLAPLIMAMAIGGLGMALTGPSSNLAIVREVPWRLQGRAFGIKQTSPPAMAMVAGLLAAAVAVPFGWRWAFALAAVLAPLAAVLLVPYLRRHPGSGAHTDGRHGAPDLSHETAPSALAVALVAAGVAFASVAISALGAFSIPTLVSLGVDVSAAAAWFAAASAVAVLSRLATGWLMDRLGSLTLTVTAVMVGGSTVGLALMSVPMPAVAAVGLVVALTLGWGWPTSMIVVVMRYWRRAGARTTGLISIGTSVGAAGGPVAFGFAAETWGYTLAWLLTCILSVLSVGFLVAARARMRGHGPQTPQPDLALQPDEPATDR